LIRISKDTHAFLTNLQKRALRKASRHTANTLPLSLPNSDRKTFTEIYKELYPAIYYFAKGFVKDEAIAEDITADTFAKLWIAAGLAGVMNAVGFLYTAAKNASLDYLKVESNLKERENQFSYQMHTGTTDEQVAAEVKAEILKHIYTEIEELPKQAREIFKLSFINGWKIRQIAEHMKLTDQTVMNQKSRALKILRLALKDRPWIWILLLNVLFFKGDNQL
jgi:RNA polymerase sigma-70 factor (family 1)